MSEKYFAGIDIGSTAIKIVLVNESGEIAAHQTSPTGCHFHRNTLNSFNTLLEKTGIKREEVVYITSTGYGRKLFKETDESISEITANAAGAREIGRDYGTVRTIINIGGQDSKVICIDEAGHVKNFAMNDKCAAGTGRFLEMTARNLDVEVDELGALHLQAKGTPLPINSTCTVFAESEIISILANGHEKEDIVAGVHYSIAKRIVRLAKRTGINDMVFFDGGPALNKGLVAAMEDELMRRIVVPEIPQITTAFGAAVIARDAFCAGGEKIYA
ncbi:MAG: acyl-CoA dehydratase activase [Candidatus Loosdrechtia sp.]|uniref:acyl-CoA dehydratase activase n=1 Tax=Candidatus Loosdrechtia sp. TaxID=3101272 RepID=UPI003A60E54C|nr:MAG: acyl-CoA dehydratase activase [Candidatus Jettenia sp. AMX2]